MRERQYSFLFRGNRPSTPFAGNTAQDFARSCRKLRVKRAGLWDFPCRSAEPWTQVWTTDVRSCVSVWAYPNNFRGLAAFVWDAVRFGWERLHRHFSV